MVVFIPPPDPDAPPPDPRVYLRAFLMVCLMFLVAAGAIGATRLLRAWLG